VLIGESNVAIDPAIGGYGVEDIYLGEFSPHSPLPGTQAGSSANIIVEIISVAVTVTQAMFFLSGDIPVELRVPRVSHRHLDSDRLGDSYSGSESLSLALSLSLRLRLRPAESRWPP